MGQYGAKLVEAFHSNMDVQAAGVSDTAMLEVTFRTDKHSVIHLEPAHRDRPAFDIVAITDPVSRGAQKVTPVLAVLQQVVNAKIRVFLNCVDKHSEMPNKSFFKQVLEPSVSFNDDGSLSA